MRTRAVRLYGKKDLRLETFDLPPIKEDEILAKIISDSLCMSSYKAAIQGSDHKRVPSNIEKNPVILGHEFCGEILEVGSCWAGRYKPGSRFTVQPAMNYKGSLDAPGYSYGFLGGDATFVIIPSEVMETESLLEYKGDAVFMGSLSEPMSCLVGAFRANYHVPQGSYNHEMGIRNGGVMAIFAGAGPMGLGAIDLALHGERKPRLLVVTDLDESRLDRACRIHSPLEAKKEGVDLIYLNTKNLKDPIEELRTLSGGDGFDDIFVLAPVKPLIEQADSLLAKNGCLNFFAGPSDPELSASINFYNVHYSFHHFVGTSGGNSEDMRIALRLMEKGQIKPQAMISHIGGLDAVISSTLNLPSLARGKILIYTHKRCELTALDQLEEKGRENPVFSPLAKIVKNNNGLWSKEAEDYFLREMEDIN